MQGRATLRPSQTSTTDTSARREAARRATAHRATARRAQAWVGEHLGRRQRRKPFLSGLKHLLNLASCFTLLDPLPVLGVGGGGGAPPETTFFNSEETIFRNWNFLSLLKELLAEDIRVRGSALFLSRHEG